MFQANNIYRRSLKELCGIVESTIFFSQCTRPILALEQLSDLYCIEKSFFPELRTLDRKNSKLCEFNKGYIPRVRGALDTHSVLRRHRSTSNNSTRECDVCESSRECACELGCVSVSSIYRRATRVQPLWMQGVVARRRNCAISKYSNVCKLTTEVREPCGLNAVVVNDFSSATLSRIVEKSNSCSAMYIKVGFRRNTFFCAFSYAQRSKTILIAFHDDPEDVWNSWEFTSKTTFYGWTIFSSWSSVDCHLLTMHFRVFRVFFHIWMLKKQTVETEYENMIIRW